MQASPERQPEDSRASTRMDARLDADTWQKVDDLARHFHRPRAAVLGHIMHWGLHRRPMEKVEQGHGEGSVHHLYLYVESELYRRVQKAATAAGVKIAPWLRQMVRHIPITAFPDSWQEARSAERSHDSHFYGKRFMLRLDRASERPLRRLAQYFDVPRAEIIRQLLAQATPDTCPASWHRRVAERHGVEAWRGRWDADEERQ